MIDIYDELGYIKNIISDGFSQKWERDATLLVRYYKMEGVKKSEAKKMIIEKCEMAARRPNNPISYDHMVNYKRMNKVFENAWKKQVQLRTIRSIEISQEVLDWFLGLEDSVVLTNEEIEYYKKRRPKIVIKNNKPMNFNRIKYLFTLYVWTKIQENYLDKPNMHYLKKYYQRFKEDANLKASFSMQNERDFLFDLGYININFALGIEASFIDKFDVFKIPITDENRIVIETGEPPYGDLYNPGYWLEKKKMGSFICKSCGKEIAHYSILKQEKNRKYCKECADVIRHGKLSEDKTIECVDCGKIVKINKFDNKTCRCPKCQKIHIKEYDRERKSLVMSEQKSAV